ncbi:hypothetical protein FRB99_004656 [Tulasnella sp. 403]|nr:hypothetical protein FRB99_004656 [Tulasnella sp. 403]
MEDDDDEEDRSVGPDANKTEEAFSIVAQIFQTQLDLYPITHTAGVSVRGVCRDFAGRLRVIRLVPNPGPASRSLPPEITRLSVKQPIELFIASLPQPTRAPGENKLDAPPMPRSP